MTSDEESLDAKKSSRSTKNLSRSKATVSNAKRNHTRLCNSLVTQLSTLTTIPDENKLYFEQEFERSKYLLSFLNEVYLDLLSITEAEDDGSLDQNNDLQDQLRI